MGRAGLLETPTPLADIIAHVKQYTGLTKGLFAWRKGVGGAGECVLVCVGGCVCDLIRPLPVPSLLVVRVAMADKHRSGGALIRSVAVCAGSGESTRGESSPLLSSSSSLSHPCRRRRCRHLIHRRASHGTHLVTPFQGSSVLQGATADLFITGEMGHHELLAAGRFSTLVSGFWW